MTVLHGRTWAPDFLASIDTDEPARQQRDTYRRATTNSLLNRMLVYDWKYTLADSDLPKVRAATDLAGVDVAYPFLSRELTDLSLVLPPSWKVPPPRCTTPPLPESPGRTASVRWSNPGSVIAA